MNEIIKLVNVSRATPDGRQAVNGVSLAINEREVAIIHGPAGSGKTALLRLIAGMDRPDTGQIFIQGRAVHEMNTGEAAAFRNRTMGICLRAPALLPDVSVWENVALPLLLRGVPAAQRRKAARVRLETLGIAYAAHARPVALAPYEQKLAALARALAVNPPILLLDEVAVDLPEREAARFLGLVQTLAEQQSMTVVSFISGQGEIPSADRHVTIEYGRITEARR